MDSSGRDVTREFRRGAEEALALAWLFRPEAVVLKEKSPSCGKLSVHSGRFDGSLIPGSGTTAFLLQREGFRVFDEKEFLAAWMNDPAFTFL